VAPTPALNFQKLANQLKDKVIIPDARALRCAPIGSPSVWLSGDSSVTVPTASALNALGEAIITRPPVFVSRQDYDFAHHI